MMYHDAYTLHIMHYFPHAAAAAAAAAASVRFYLQGWVIPPLQGG